MNPLVKQSIHYLKWFLCFPLPEVKSPTSTPSPGRCPPEQGEPLNERINCIPEQHPTKVCQKSSG